MQQVGTQGDRAAVVVRHDVRTLQSPVVEEVGERITLDVQRDPMIGILRRAAVPRHVPQVHRELGGQRSAYGRHSSDDHGVPWQNTTSGPAPARPHRTRRPRQSNCSISSTAPSYLPKWKVPAHTFQHGKHERLPNPEDAAAVLDEADRSRSHLVDDLTLPPHYHLWIGE